MSNNRITPENFRERLSSQNDKIIQFNLLRIKYVDFDNLEKIIKTELQKMGGDAKNGNQCNIQ